MNIKIPVLYAAVFLTLMCLTAFGQESVTQRKEGEVWFEPFKITVEGKPVEGDIGHLMVRENRAKKDSNLIELVFLRLKSTAEKPGNPVVYLDGGPGSSPIGLAYVPDYMRAFEKLREVGDVYLLDQRGVGRSKPNLTRIAAESFPPDIFADEALAQKIFNARIKEAADHFRSQGMDIAAYNTRESAHDVDDLRKAIGAAKINLVGFSYGTHLGLACLRYHGENLDRVVLFGTEGPNNTDKLPFTSDKALKKLAEIAAADAEIGSKVPDLVGMLKRVMDRLEKEPATVTITDRRTRKPVDIKVSKFGLQFLIMRDLGDTNDLPIFPAWFYTMDKGDYSILKTFAERRYNQFGGGISLMTVMMDAASGTTKERAARIEREAKTALLGKMVNFPSLNVEGVSDNVDLGDEYRSALRTAVPTLFVSGELDNNTPPWQADEVRKFFTKSIHLVVGNAGHESTLVDPRMQQVMVDYLNGKDVRKTQISLPKLKFVPIPDNKKP
ncbi:MAG TPA: alpha/beta fold hydrolase [Pyrinomonadaceae bacterium]|jgi:pimeloyl-ACP methyl ester carboxylesterase|nr:alpha/beta fold hydrolase [Pyrinomonadaceae bacterium]